MVDASKGEGGVVKGLFDVLFHSVHYSKNKAQIKLISKIITPTFPMYSSTVDGRVEDRCRFCLFIIACSFTFGILTPCVFITNPLDRVAKASKVGTLAFHGSVMKVTHRLHDPRECPCRDPTSHAIVVSNRDKLPIRVEHSHLEIFRLDSVGILRLFVFAKVSTLTIVAQSILDRYRVTVGCSPMETTLTMCDL